MEIKYSITHLYNYSAMKSTIHVESKNYHCTITMIAYLFSQNHVWIQMIEHHDNKIYDVFREYIPYNFDAVTLKQISNKIYPQLFESIEPSLQREAHKLRTIMFGV